MSKKRTSLSLDEPIADEVQRRDELNLSGLVNDFLRGYLSYGDKTSAALEARLEALERQREQLQTELDDVESEMEEVQELIEAQHETADKHDDVLDDLAEDLAYGDDLHRENPAVQTWARKLELRPQDLVAEIQQRRNGAHG